MDHSRPRCTFGISGQRKLWRSTGPGSQLGPASEAPQNQSAYDDKGEQQKEYLDIVVVVAGWPALVVHVGVAVR